MFNNNFSSLDSSIEVNKLYPNIETEYSWGFDLGRDKFFGLSSLHNQLVLSKSKTEYIKKSYDDCLNESNFIPAYTVVDLINIINKFECQLDIKYLGGGGNLIVHAHGIFRFGTSAEFLATCLAQSVVMLEKHFRC